MAAGAEAIQRRTEVMHEFARLIEVNAAGLPKPPRLPPMATEAIVGGVYEVIFRRIAAGQAETLPEMLPDVVELCLMPYVGEPKARKTAEALRQSRDDAVEAVAAELAG